jgi:hypothetical protein
MYGCKSHRVIDPKIPAKQVQLNFGAFKIKLNLVFDENVKSSNIFLHLLKTTVKYKNY